MTVLKMTDVVCSSRQLNVVTPWQVLRITQEGDGIIVVSGVGESREDVEAERKPTNSWGIMGKLVSEDGQVVVRRIGMAGVETTPQASLEKVGRYLTKKSVTPEKIAGLPQTRWRLVPDDRGVLKLEYLGSKLPLGWVE